VKRETKWMKKVKREDEQWKNDKEKGIEEVLKTCHFRHLSSSALERKIGGSFSLLDAGCGLSVT
jgi:hypothetical protein